MKLHFECPICSAELSLSSTEISGPCPTCQNTLQVKVEISALEPALRAESLSDNESPERSRKVGNWKCSGKPHGTFNGAVRAY